MLNSEKKIAYSSNLREIGNRSCLQFTINCISLILYCRYANNESYSRAVEDFEVALKLDSKHVNAKKYMCETLLAHAQMYVLCFKRSHYSCRFHFKNHISVQFDITFVEHSSKSCKL